MLACISTGVVCGIWGYVTQTGSNPSNMKGVRAQSWRGPHARSPRRRRSRRHLGSLRQFFFFMVAHVLLEDARLSPQGSSRRREGQGEKGPTERMDCRPPVDDPHAEQGLLMVFLGAMQFVAV
eukprot:COSAG02_NODE_29739_length_564_cov_0.707527_2_plen_122_part_01